MLYQISSLYKILNCAESGIYLLGSVCPGGVLQAEYTWKLEITIYSAAGAIRTLGAGVLYLAIPLTVFLSPFIDVAVTSMSMRGLSAFGQVAGGAGCSPVGQKFNTAQSLGR